ncbi:MAG: electron transport complex subunit RsxB [Enterobacterales bacterium]|nr:electron transport complex subunit RsxB [Enterobacterales bacterium]
MVELLIAPTIIALLALAGGALLGYASVKFKAQGDPLVEQINDKLPQTQCGQCGFAGCKPYAEAIADGVAINRCPPGGEEGIKALAQLLEVEIIPLDETCGEEAPPRVAVIIEQQCIGCTKCIQACPVDAIVGAAKQMHTVIESECTGCDLCVPPCPVDCIEMPFVVQNKLPIKPRSAGINPLESIAIKQVG